jgi:putative membrane protein
MIATKGIHLGMLIRWTWHHIVWLTLGATLFTMAYHFEWITLSIPWLPVSVVGTAVAFYVGFKNNQSYDRLWEARKIWGGIVNESRTWGMLVDGYISDLHAQEKIDEEEIKEIKKRLIYRHIAWLYAHRNQLLQPTPWEHISQRGAIGKYAKYYQENFGVGLIDDGVTKTEMQHFLSQEEYERLIQHQNTATQIVNEQSRDLAALRRQNLIEDFRHIQMSDVLRSLYTLQGKNERIKKYPLPRQYANMSFYFTGIFIMLLPFSMIPAIMGSGAYGIWLSVPITALVGWVYVMMEVVGDYSENPFQGMGNDIPMLSLCRVIEIDLREMLGEKDLPANIEITNGVLM